MVKLIGVSRICIHLLRFTMFYAVEITDPCDTFAGEYMAGCERVFSSVKEAESYLSTFEDWEQPLLCIKSKNR